MASDLSEAMNGLALEAKLPLLRLPRELRDNIYDLLALSEDQLHLRIVLGKGSKPQKLFFTAEAFGRNDRLVKTDYTDLGRTSSQLRQEYAVALERRVRLLMTTRDLAGNRLGAPGKNQQVDVTARLHISQAKRADEPIAQNVHALTIPVRFSDWTRVQWARDSWDLGERPSLVVHFAIDEDEVLEARGCIQGPLLDVGQTARDDLFNWPEGAVPATKQVVNTAKATDWKGSFGFYALWHNYVMRYTSKEILRE